MESIACPIIMAILKGEREKRREEMYEHDYGMLMSKKQEFKFHIFYWTRLTSACVMQKMNVHFEPLFPIFSYPMMYSQACLLCFPAPARCGRGGYGGSTFARALDMIFTNYSLLCLTIELLMKLMFPCQSIYVRCMYSYKCRLLLM